MKRIATLVLAVLMVLSLFACAAADETAAVMTHDEYVAAELETEVTVETYVQAHQSWWNDQITIYARAKTARTSSTTPPATPRPPRSWFPAPRSA